jgi:hypothetical protein
MGPRGAYRARLPPDPAIRRIDGFAELPLG